MTLIRPISPEDRKAIENWIAGEPSHANNTFEFYTESGCKSLIFGDEEGDIIAGKFTPCLRIDLEFNPDANPKRIAKLLTEGLSEMELAARAQGFKQFVFDSLSERLVKFCAKLGFRTSPDYVKTI